MLDNFREWLSDNLRYILLILAIFVALALVFFGIRAITGTGSSGRSERTNEAPSPTETIELSNEPMDTTPTPTEAPESVIIGGEIKDDVYPDVASVITTYYESRQNHSVEGVRSVVDVLSDEDAQAIEKSSTVYSDLKIYTKEGPEGDDTSFVAYVSYKYQNADQSTLFPGLERMLVKKDDSGAYKIVFTPLDDATSDYIDSLADSDDVKELISRVQLEFETAQAIEDAARASGDDTGVQDNSQSEMLLTDGEVIENRALVLSDVNLREGAGTEYPVITVLKAGQTVTVIGEKYNECYYVVSGSGDGYVNADFLQIETADDAIAPSSTEGGESTGTIEAQDNSDTPEDTENENRSAGAEAEDEEEDTSRDDSGDDGEGDDEGEAEEPEDAGPAAPAAENWPDTWSDTVNTGGVNLRAAEGMDAAVIGTLTRGETVTITGSAHNGWYHVVSSSLGEGYVGSRFVGTAPAESTDNVWSDIINGGVNLRAAEGMDAAIIGVLLPGEAVTISGEAHNGWYHVVASRLGEGYIGTRFVGAASETASSAPAVGATTDSAGREVPEASSTSTAPVYDGERSTTVKVGCNLREGPGADYNVVGVLDYGAQVSVLGTSSNGNWYHIRTAVGEGYVNVGFLA